jgi:Ser/Thr protein kinase RdoA (MazF antagonist)
MAQLHVHGASFQRPRGFRCPCWDWNGIFGADSPLAPQVPRKLPKAIQALFDSVQERTKRVVRSLGKGPDVFGLIHGDLIQANYVIDRGRVGAIDFADFGMGYFLYDMAVTLLMLRPFDIHGSQRRAFIEGYREVNALTREHEALLDLFIAARAVALARSALGARNRHPENVEWVKQNLPWLRKMDLYQ